MEQFPPKFSFPTLATAISGSPGAEGPWVMGVLNVTPNSFSDGGLFFEPTAALQHAEMMLAGADVIDVGGEATGPGSAAVPIDVELARVVPLVEQLAPIRPVSVDTYKAAVARRCLESGAAMINDISALRADPEMVWVLRDFRAPVILMYSKERSGLPHVSGIDRRYRDVVLEVGDFLAERIDFALDSGMRAEQIVLDPGMGAFLSLRPEISWEVLSRFAELTSRFIGFPLMIATSRKGFLGGPLKGRDPVSQLTALIAVTRGAALVRTHNPAQMKEFLQAYRKSLPPEDAAPL